ncbi:hypothetical protein ABK040_014827 [Willaertia magna]
MILFFLNEFQQAFTDDKDFIVPFGPLDTKFSAVKLVKKLFIDPIENVICIKNSENFYSSQLICITKNKYLYQFNEQNGKLLYFNNFNNFKNNFKNSFENCKIPLILNLNNFCNEFKIKQPTNIIVDQTLQNLTIIVELKNNSGFQLLQFYLTKNNFILKLKTKVFLLKSIFGKDCKYINLNQDILFIITKKNEIKLYDWKALQKNFTTLIHPSNEEEENNFNFELENCYMKLVKKKRIVNGREIIDEEQEQFEKIKEIPCTMDFTKFNNNLNNNLNNLNNKIEEQQQQLVQPLLLVLTNTIPKSIKEFQYQVTFKTENDHLQFHPFHIETCTVDKKNQRNIRFILWYLNNKNKNHTINSQLNNQLNENKYVIEPVKDPNRLLSYQLRYNQQIYSFNENENELEANIIFDRNGRFIFITSYFLRVISLNPFDYSKIKKIHYEYQFVLQQSTNIITNHNNSNQQQQQQQQNNKENSRNNNNNNSDNNETSSDSDSMELDESEEEEEEENNNNLRTRKNRIYYGHNPTILTYDYDSELDCIVLLTSESMIYLIRNCDGYLLKKYHLQKLLENIGSGNSELKLIKNLNEKSILFDIDIYLSGSKIFIIYKPNNKTVVLSFEINISP